MRSEGSVAGGNGALTRDQETQVGPTARAAPPATPRPGRQGRFRCRKGKAGRGNGCLSWEAGRASSGGGRRDLAPLPAPHRMRRRLPRERARPSARLTAAKRAPRPHNPPTRWTSVPVCAPLSACSCASAFSQLSSFCPPMRPQASPPTRWHAHGRAHVPPVAVRVRPTPSRLAQELRQGPHPSTRAPTHSARATPPTPSLPIARAPAHRYHPHASACLHARTPV